MLNHQYDLIMREYSRRQARGLRIAQEHRQEVASRFPRLTQIDEEVARLGADTIRQVLAGSREEKEHLKDKIALLSKERKELLVQNGYPEDYLEPSYTCPLCQDTGYIGNRKCSCFRNAQISLLYSQSGIRQILEKEDFENFSFDFYSDTLTGSKSSLTERAMAKNAYDASRRFVRNFDTSFQNLFFYGDTGVGKTFLSHCIAHELLESAHSVIYFSAQELFDRLASYAFGAREQEGSQEDILEAELLIIDDLGTELTNSFVSSQLFLCVNERILRQRSTIISTNLSLEEFTSTYSERTFSRIAGNYQMCKIMGKDIRLLKVFASKC